MGKPLGCPRCLGSGRTSNDPEAYGVVVDCAECRGFGVIPVKLALPRTLPRTMDDYYRGYRLEYGCVVRNFYGVRVPLRLDLWNHSPSGFEWGYAGSGPAQTALAVLADYTDNDKTSVRLHQEFKRRVVARFPNDGSWLMRRRALKSYVDNLPNQDDAFWKRWFDEQLDGGGVVLYDHVTDEPYPGHVCLTAR
jgi:hypothetical protein